MVMWPFKTQKWAFNFAEFLAVKNGRRYRVEKSPTGTWVALSTDRPAPTLVNANEPCS